MRIISILFTCALVVVCCYVPLFAQTDCKGPTQYVSPCYETVKLSESVYAFIAPESPSPVVTGNSVLVIGRDSALVFDSGHFPSVTRHLIADVKRLTTKPVRYLVVSHWHPDHNAGNGLFQEAFPGIAIVSTSYTRQQWEKQVVKNADPKLYAGTVEAIEKMLAAGKYLDGSPLNDVRRKYLVDAKAEFQWMLPEVEQAKHTAPNLIFEKTLRVDLGGKVATIMFAGRGNTGGDAVVYVPDDKVLVTGDLLVYPSPYAIGSYPTDWIQTLRKLNKIDASFIVPGHGRVQRDKSYITQVTSLLESMNKQVATAVQQGKTLEQTRASVQFNDFSRTLPTEPAWKLAFEEFFMKPGVERAYKEAKEGKLID